MAVHSIDVKGVLTRVRKIIPEASETHVISLINDALVELGQYDTKVEYAKTSSVADQMWYDLSDSGSGVEINKVFRVDYMDDDGEYVRIPRLLNGEILKMDLT